MTVSLTWGDVCIHILIAALTGIIVSFIFLRFILYFLRPRIVISPEVAIEVDGAGIHTFWFKAVNHSKWEGFELNFSAEVISYEPAQNGCYHLKHSSIVPLVKGSFSMIPRYQSDRKIRKQRTSAPHCFQVRTMENISHIVQDKNHFVVLHVSCKHGLSGIFKSFDQEFTHQSTIKKGNFSFGNQLVVK